mmetsp:Transcript_64444/g.119884  ORF Transcript_64444/g.119884 Transcript_64444/m.119884 type:complete len:152 (+) Transcript_64444:83-538(+)
MRVLRRSASVLPALCMAMAATSVLSWLVLPTDSTSFLSSRSTRPRREVWMRSTKIVDEIEAWRQSLTDEERLLFEQTVNETWAPNGDMDEEVDPEQVQAVGKLLAQYLSGGFADDEEAERAFYQHSQDAAGSRSDGQLDVEVLSSSQESEK